MRTDAEWILSAQLPDGAITTGSGRTAIWPYLGNYAAMGLARAAQLTGTTAYADAAWKWLAWYQAHQDASGFVTDYTVGGDGEVSTGAMDSTDAYAGTFLIAARAAWLATHDRGALRTLGAGIAAAVKAIEATQTSDGLTWAKPGFHIKYLLDQAEAYAGLRAAATLAGATGAGALSQRAMLDAARMRNGVAGLWNPAVGAYSWARGENGAATPAQWSVLYPDAVAQAWSVAFGLARGARAARLMRHFAAAQPQWDEPTARGRFRPAPQRVGYWPVVGWAFAAVGNGGLGTAASAKIEAAAEKVGRDWPFTTADAGELILLGDANDRLGPILRPVGSH
ncbi:MAG TPA: hypothetical protein VG294_15630 [Solirubrobacteraceae bacterium]|nr:hypothetical protein [Solirubrobacteraceae bacterium]